jgi:hypothetical protein
MRRLCIRGVSAIPRRDGDLRVGTDLPVRSCQIIYKLHE